LEDNCYSLIFAARSDKTGSSLKKKSDCKLKKKEKETAKSLLVKQETPTFAVRLKKRGKFFTKQIDYHSKRFKFYLKINDEKFGRNNKTLTFALPNKTG